MDDETGVIASPNGIDDDDQDEPIIKPPPPHTIKSTIPTKISISMATHSYKYLLGSLLSAFILSLIGIIVGDFKIAVENEGWKSRKTLISNREIQSNLILKNQNFLFEYEGAWEVLRSDSRYGVSTGEDGDDRRRLDGGRNVEERGDDGYVEERGGDGYVEERGGDGCGWYSSFINREFLLSTWKPKSASTSALDPAILKEICRAEQNTLSLLKSQTGGGALCETCNGQCLQPQSLVLVLRGYLNGAEGVNDREPMACDELLADTYYTPEVQADFTTMLATCIDYIKETFDSETTTTTDVNNSNSTTTTAPCP